MPVPRAISFKDAKPSKVASGSSTLSSTFQILPASAKIAPLISPAIGNLYSRFKANFRLASLKSLIAEVLPGPNEYGNQALLSLEPPPK